MAKNTLRDKDWPMIRRLVEVHYLSNRDHATPEQVRFWLDELRTRALLVELAARDPDAARRGCERRSLLAHALTESEAELQRELDEEERREREADRRYWQPLRAELETLCHTQA